jgi:4-hydroxy-tetrahydrodipicolinate synthase
LTGLVRRLVEAGVHGFVVCGTTGEPAALSDAEKAVVLDTVLAACGDRPVLMGASGITPSRWRRSASSGAAGASPAFLVPPPCYVRPTQQGVIDFYGQVAAAAAPHALIVYDIPYRTGVELTLATLRTLAGIPGVRGVKDCGGDAHKTQALIADAQLDLLAGEDHLIFTHLCQGGSGAIAASAHLHPQHFVAMFEALRDAAAHRRTRRAPRIGTAGRRTLRRAEPGAAESGARLARPDRARAASRDDTGERRRGGTRAGGPRQAWVMLRAVNATCHLSSVRPPDESLDVDVERFRPDRTLNPGVSYPEGHETPRGLFAVRTPRGDSAGLRLHPH